MYKVKCLLLVDRANLGGFPIGLGEDQITGIADGVVVM